jgi:hypothetical protein
MNPAPETYRRDARVEGVPFAWSTNLDNEGIVALYGLIAPDLAEFGRPPSIQGPVIKISLQSVFFSTAVQFRDGICRCLCVGDVMHAIYKTTEDWELWFARQDEVDELRREQKNDAAIALARVQEQAEFIEAQEAEAIQRGDFDSALQLILTRADLLKSKGSPSDFYNFRANVVWARLKAMPGTHGLQVLRRCGSQGAIFIHLLRAKEWTAGVPEAEFLVLCEGAAAAFPSDGRLWAQIALFWARRKHWIEAKSWCQRAMERNLTDDTKSGFAGRLARFEKLASIEDARSR